MEERTNTNPKSNLIPIAILGLLVAACIVGLYIFRNDNKDLENRISDVEGRLASMEVARPSTAMSESAMAAMDTPAPEAEVQPDGPLPSMAFNEETFDFGTIKEGDEVEHIFAFTNMGEAPLIISSAKGSCGCTVPEWPKEPIGVGKKGSIKVKFSSKGKTGAQSKTVTITSNTFPADTKIQIKANVLAAPVTDGPVK